MDSELQAYIDTWETKLASAHGWDIDHDTMQAILHVNEAARKVANLPDFDKWYDFLIYRNGRYIDIEDDDPLLEWIRDMLRLLKPEVARDMPQGMGQANDGS